MNARTKEKTKTKEETRTATNTCDTCGRVFITTLLATAAAIGLWALLCAICACCTYGPHLLVAYVKAIIGG